MEIEKKKNKDFEFLLEKKRYLNFDGGELSFQGIFGFFIGPPISKFTPWPPPQACIFCPRAGNMKR